MSRNTFNFEIPANKRASKDELIKILTPMVGESLAKKFADYRPEPIDVDVLKPWMILFASPSAAGMILL